MMRYYPNLFLALTTLGCVGDSRPLHGGNAAADGGAADISDECRRAVGTLCAFFQEGYLKASNSGSHDFFGISVALSGDGNTLAVGADEASNATGVNGDQTDNSARDSGAVYIFVRTGNAWSQQAYIKASNTDPGDHFGRSVALSYDGNTLAVGAYGEASIATGVNGDQTDNSDDISGAVYVFTRSDTTWSQEAYVKASNTEGDLFGYSVALSAAGDTLAVGAYGEDSSATGVNGNQADNSAGISGAVYIFERRGDIWSQEAYVKASNTDPRDNFGHSVALSGDGNTLAAGAPGEDSSASGVNGDQDDNSIIDSGAVYVFARSDNTWSQEAYLKSSHPNGRANFGWSVALNGDGSTLAAGAPFKNGGAVDIFVQRERHWSHQSNLKTSHTDPDLFGRVVALSDSGNNLVVGAYGEASNATGVNGDQTDNSAAESGAAYVFVRAGATWSQGAYLKASNADATDRFGVSVALSGNGNTLAAGALLEGSNATGVNGDQTDNSESSSGAAYVFVRRPAR